VGGEETGIDAPVSNVVSADLFDCAGNKLNVSNLAVPVSFLLVIDPTALLGPSDIVTRCSVDSSYLPNDGAIVNQTQQLSKEVQCSYYSDELQDWITDGCVVADANVTTADGEQAVLCECTHLTEFAILLREKNSLDTSSCNLSPAGVFGSIVYLVFACIFSLMLLVGLRQMYYVVLVFKMTNKLMLGQHLLLCLVCVFRIAVCVLYYMLQYAAVRAVIEFKAVAVISGLPYILMIWLFSTLLVSWISIFYAVRESMAALQGDTFKKWKPYFVAGNVLVTLLFGTLFVLIALSTDAAVRQKMTLAGSVLFASLVLVMSSAYARYGYGLLVELSKDFKSTSAERLCKVGVVFSFCFLGEAIIWVISGVAPEVYFGNFELTTSVFLLLELTALACILLVSYKTLMGAVTNKKATRYKPKKYVPRLITAATRKTNVTAKKGAKGSKAAAAASQKSAMGVAQGGATAVPVRVRSEASAAAPSAGHGSATGAPDTPVAAALAPAPSRVVHLPFDAPPARGHTARTGSAVAYRRLLHDIACTRLVQPLETTRVFLRGGGDVDVDGWFGPSGEPESPAEASSTTSDGVGFAFAALVGAPGPDWSTTVSSPTVTTLSTSSDRDTDNTGALQPTVQRAAGKAASVSSVSSVPTDMLSLSTTSPSTLSHDFDWKVPTWSGSSGDVSDLRVDAGDAVSVSSVSSVPTEMLLVSITTPSTSSHKLDGKESAVSQANAIGGHDDSGNARDGGSRVVPLRADADAQRGAGDAASVSSVSSVPTEMLLISSTPPSSCSSAPDMGWKEPAVSKVHIVGGHDDSSGGNSEVELTTTRAAGAAFTQDGTTSELSEEERALVRSMEKFDAVEQGMYDEITRYMDGQASRSSSSSANRSSGSVAPASWLDAREQEIEADTPVGGVSHWFQEY
jgi:hypothetical protein